MRRFDGLYDIGQVNSSSSGDFLDGPVVKTPCFPYRGQGFTLQSGKFDPTGHKAQSKKKNLILSFLVVKMESTEVASHWIVLKIK